MRIGENSGVALRALAANKLRAGLTTLGIMIGVSAVITLLAIGDGVTRFVADQFIGLGTNLVFIQPDDGDGRSLSSLTTRDAEQLADITLVPNVTGVAPVVFRGGALQYQGMAFETTVNASTPDYGTVRGYVTERGRFIDDTDYHARSRVAVIGRDVADNLFPDDVDPLGTNIKIRGLNFRVIGILEEKGGGFFGSSDNLVIIPLTTAQERLYNFSRTRNGQLRVDMILMQAVDSEAIGDVLIDATNALRQLHNINFRDEDDFLMLTQQDFLTSFGAVTGVLTLFLGAIASISLLVGGIGVMNIMLVSVTERTKEIGLRKAVGAKRGDILSQFLTEAIVLALIGGILGTGLGFAGATAVQFALPDLNTSVTINSVALAMGFSAAIGLFFGIYPAWRAASLHPIDALRFE
jgi:putative ABC transport system permease protein